MNNIDNVMWVARELVSHCSQAKDLADDLQRSLERQDFVRCQYLLAQLTSTAENVFHNARASARYVHKMLKEQKAEAAA